MQPSSGTRRFQQGIAKQRIQAHVQLAPATLKGSRRGLDFDPENDTQSDHFVREEVLVDDQIDGIGRDPCLRWKLIAGFLAGKMKVVLSRKQKV
jgi:hypothetical protein